MKVNTVNYDHTILVLKESLERFIKYIEECRFTTKWLWDDYEKYNTIFQKIGQDAFVQKYNIDMQEAAEDNKYLKLYEPAKLMLENLDDIHVKLIEIFIEPTGTVYPGKCIDWVNYFNRFCVNDGEMLSLIEQNDSLNNYPHFPAGNKNGKRSKALGHFKPAIVDQLVAN